MKLSHFFIDHPRFAAVVSIFIVVFGLAAAAFLPVAQYPNIVPPTVQITASYPGASADVVARTVATPLEQAINGVENMDYISSQSTGNGQLNITVIFKIGTNINTALMLTHNRVQDTLSRLPQEVQLEGVQVKKTIPALLLGIHPYSPDGSRSAEYISNYFILHVRDEIARLPGVSDFWILGERQYAMRIWIDPDRAAASAISASDILNVLRAQNTQVSAGALNQPPVFNDSGGAYQMNVRALGRLTTPEQFGNIIVKSDSQGRVTRIRDIGHVELGALDYGSKGYADRYDSAPFWVIATPGADVVQVEHEVWDKMAQLKKNFPPGIDYINIYDPTTFVSQSIHEVLKTIVIAIFLVVGVVYLFLQSWRATIIPVIAIPVSLLGSFSILAQPVIVWLGVGGGHRGRRRHRRGRERRAQHGGRHVVARGDASHDERSIHRAHRHRADPVRCLCAVGLHLWHLGPVLQAVRDHHRRFDGDFLLCLAHLEPRARGGSSEAAQRPCRTAGTEPDRAGRVLSLQRRFRVDVFQIRQDDSPLCAGDCPHPCRLCRTDLAHGLPIRPDAHRLHSGSGHWLSRHRHPATGGIKSSSD
jgi:hypothetical protein